MTSYVQKIVAVIFKYSENSLLIRVCHIIHLHRTGQQMLLLYFKG
jgi:hypothetical protein